MCYFKTILLNLLFCLGTCSQLRNGHGKDARSRKHSPTQLHSFDSNDRISVNDKEYDFSSFEEIDMILVRFLVTADRKETNVTSKKSY